MENEAPAIIWTEAQTEGGFVINITRRGESLQPLLDDIKAFVKENKLTPHERYQSKGSQKGPQSFQNPPTPTKECFEHKVPMKQKISKKTGNPYFSHWENEGQYPNLGRQCFGDGWTEK